MSTRADVGSYSGNSNSDQCLIMGPCINITLHSGETPLFINSTFISTVQNAITDKSASGGRHSMGVPGSYPLGWQDGTSPVALLP